MKGFSKYHFIWRKKGMLYVLLPLVATALIMTTMITVILSNTYHLKRHLEGYTETYSYHAAEQLAERISFRLKQRSRDLEALSISFSNMPDEILTEELIEQKRKNLDVDRLFILDEDGTVFPKKEKAGDVKEYIKEENVVTNYAYLSVMGKNQVVFSTPFKKDGRIRYLVSVCMGRTLQNILEDFNYKGDSCCCIVNKEGKLVIAPLDMAPFQKLHSIFDGNNVPEKQKQSIEDVLTYITKEKSGWTVFQDIDNQDLILGYDYLDVADWGLLTITPSDVLSSTVKGYTNRFISIALSLIVITIFILSAIVQIYQKNMKHIRQAALTDTLTNGDNENAFRMRVEYRLKENPEQEHAIVYMNNKDFSCHNRRFGISVANQILCSIYETIQEHLNEGELVARCNGTSFALLLETNDEDLLTKRLSALSNAIIQKLQDIYAIDNHQITTGVYCIRSNAHEFIHMLDWAKIASTYNTKRESCKIFDDSIVQVLHREDELNNSFRRGIERREFKLYIQPKVSPHNNKLVGGEVLVRWEHPEYGLIPPNEFVPLFEKNGNICTLDFYMFEEACRLLSQWLEEGRGIPLSVNLSRVHLRAHDLGFLDGFFQLKKKYHIPDNMIELELTESVMLERQETPFVLQVIEQIQTMGFFCSMDDFGYGYSCLTLLKDLKVNTVKLDRQFFLNENNRSWVVIDQLVQLAHRLDITVVAEGIENWEQVEKVKACNCDSIQGYVYAKPMDILTFTEWESKYF